ncbi:gluconate 2-dehydrogenase subunit 3 family protein [Paenibacillus doosanensis]|uniref:Gluconate 2-dehydrogenase subunit 3 n=1 Tax=Paenibacillus konkukensis TaxID=2020716 RepID=A0ABY4RV59_9BACL|nr:MULTISPECIES: gluconate 2-dehydrogenase subunit 3 family protein [Paenibacillus]MCS7458936.1 gluconate 2-dehydrogenase subunit 3 family protein [Paenibacillus doosanensis]UQZ86536.1 Gluconate 2-dehydrogenase subunit 3 precursor [Paenibacillus konkukensis]
MPEHRDNQPQSDSRRKFLKYSGAAIGGVVVGGVVGGVIGKSLGGKPAEPAKQPNEAQPEAADYNQALMFFNQEQFRITEAATERIFPKDDLGPGAKELGVAYFIDHQLAGQWGINAQDYMMGPFQKGETTQGDYPSVKRHELFTMGLQAIQNLSQQKYKKSFLDLAEAEQDEVLKALENGADISLYGTTGQAFFKTLISFTTEGVYADPLYGGNKNMGGWKMKNYPGNQMSYLDVVDKKEFVKMEPQSLRDHLSH